MRSQLVFLMTLVIYLCGCSKEHAGRYVEIIALDKQSPQAFSLQSKELHDGVSFANPEVYGENLVLIANAQLFHNSIAKHALNSSSFSQLAGAIKQSFHGEPINLKISTFNGIIKAESFESLVTMSALFHLDEIFRFAQKQLVLGQNALTEPLTVAVMGQILFSEEFAYPLTVDDNAIYVGAADTIFLLPHGANTPLPLSMHEGVLAHELHHRIFFKEVWTDPQFENLWPVFQDRYNPIKNRISHRSRIIMNALDEGLADVFAVAFTGLPNYLNVSLTEDVSAKVRLQRDLEGEFANRANYDLLAASNLPPHLLAMCGGRSRNFQNLSFNGYCLGTVIAKMLYQTANKNVSKLRDVILPLVAESLPSVARKLNDTFEFDLDVFFNAMAERAALRSPELKKRLCAEIRKRFYSLANNERIPACEFS